MKTFKIVILTAVISLFFGLMGGYVFTGLYESYKDGDIATSIEQKYTVVDYPNVESSNYEVVVNKAYDTIVEIQSTVYTTSFFGQSESGKLGSGVIISEDGYIVTNNHVIQDATRVTISTSTGEEYDATIIGADEKCDIAIIKINANNLKYAMLADSDELKLGQEVMAIGNPLGEGLSCCNGIISALSRDIVVEGNPMTLIQTNAAINAGNSGGGLFNMNGDLIGIVNAKSSTSYFGETSIEGIGYAIPSNTVSKIMDDLMEYGFVKQRATLGVSVYTSPYRYNDVTGLLIETVVSGSAADEAGLKNGDLIIKIDGEEIDNYTTMMKIIQKHEIGDIVEVTVLRDGSEKTVSAKLKEATKN